MRHSLLALGLLMNSMVCLGSDGPEYNDKGELVLPSDYREWVFMSSGLGMTYGPAAAANGQPPFFDNVFVNPSSWRAFKQTGQWPDKTMFVLEIRFSHSKNSVNNGGSFQTDVSAVEASVKDKARFGDKWAYFGFGSALMGHRTTAQAAPPQASCTACHSANGAVEWTFTQFYPQAMEIAKAKGTVRASYQAPPPSPAALGHAYRTGGWTKALDLLNEVKAKDAEAPVLNEATLNAFGYLLLRSDRTTAIEVLRFATRQYPTSANAWDSLSEVLEGAGQKPEALAAARKGLELLPSDKSQVGDRRALLEKGLAERISRLTN